MRYLFLPVLFLCLFLPPQYIIVFSVVLAFISFFRNTSIFYRITGCNFFVFLVFLLYIYGIILGYFSSYPIDHVLRNTTGLLGILSFFLFSDRNISYRFLGRSIFLLGFLFTACTLVLSLLISFRLWEPLQILIDLFGATGGLDGNIRFYSPVLFLSFFFIFPLLFCPKYTLFELFDLKYTKPGVIFLIRGISFAFFLILSLLMQSKAFVLLYPLMFMNFIVMSSSLPLSPSLAASKFKLSTILIIILTLFLFLVSFDMLISNFNPFSVGLTGNEERISQLATLEYYLSLFGNGSGASLPTFLIRDINAPYGTEVSYFGVIYVYGIFSVVLLFPILLSFLAPLASLLIPYTNRLRFPHRFYVSIAFLLANSPFFVLAIGNPVFFTPSLWFLFGASFGLFSKSFFNSSLSSPCGFK